MLGQQLLNTGLISKDQLQIALTEQKVTRKRLGSLLVEFGFLEDEKLHEYFGHRKRTNLVTLEKTCPDKTALILIPKDICERYKVIPVSYELKTKKLTVAIADPDNLAVTDGIRRSVNAEIKLIYVMASESAIKRAQRDYYGAIDSFEILIDELENQGESSERNTGKGTPKQTVVKLVNFLLSDAAVLSASDIHFEPEKYYLRIRHRIDGVLTEKHSIHKKHWPAIAIRLKIMAEMDIAETRTPQDGSFSRTIYGALTDFRVSTFPTIHGENIVLRILSRNKAVLDLEQLGFDEATIGKVRKTLCAPDGLVLVAGPTGSGKTTTLYSLINEINTSAVNIMTLEDPVEYPLNGVRQSCIKDGQKFSYYEGVKAILRQDPDVVLIGEIRDSETAKIAIRAAMTGHKVYSTIHTKDAISAVSRLTELGVSPKLLSTNLHAVIAQRLVRRCCTQCANKAVEGNSVCLSCEGAEYRGRFAIAEVLDIDLRMEEMIGEQFSKNEILKYAYQCGWKPLQEVGSIRVLHGDTDCKELERVLGIVSDVTATTAQVENHGLV